MGDRGSLRLRSSGLGKGRGRVGGRRSALRDDEVKATQRHAFHAGLPRLSCRLRACLGCDGTPRVRQIAPSDDGRGDCPDPANACRSGTHCISSRLACALLQPRAEAPYLANCHGRIAKAAPAPPRHDPRSLRLRACISTSGFGGCGLDALRGGTGRTGASP